MKRRLSEPDIDGLVTPASVEEYLTGSRRTAFPLLKYTERTDRLARSLLDGRIARSRNLITNFGKFMDPIADKLLTHTAFIMLTAIGRLNVTACIIFIAREFVVSGLRLCAVEQGHVIAAGMSGKIKTVLQMMLVVVLTITGEGLLPALLTIAASVMTLYSMCEYVWQNRAVLGGAK